MKDLTVFHTTYKELLKQYKGWEEAFRLANIAQHAFNETYLTVAAKAEALQPVDAKTGLQNFTEALKQDTGGMIDKALKAFKDNPLLEGSWVKETSSGVEHPEQDQDQAESFDWKLVFKC